MTPREKQCLDFVTGYIAEHGVSPTYRQIANAMGYGSISNITRLVRALRRQGALRYSPNHRRGLQPAKAADARFLEAADEFCRALSNGHAVAGGTRERLLAAWGEWRP